jgi:hypothetical protein
MANEEVTTQEELTPKQELLKEMDIENRYSHLDTGRLLKDAEPSDENLKQAKKELKAWSPTTKHEGEIIDKLDELYPDEEQIKHTITWKDGDDVLKTTEVEEGKLPVYGDDPTKEGFDFIGWEPELVEATEDATYVAKWEEHQVTTTHTITWKDGDDVLKTTEVEDGEVPTYGEENPTKEGFDFTGWDPEIVAATEDATYTAQFEQQEEDIVTHTITWDVDGTTTTTEVEDGETPVYDGEEPTKEGYTFTGWDPEIVAATEDATYTAQFEENPQDEEPENGEE